MSKPAYKRTAVEEFVCAMERRGIQIDRRLVNNIMDLERKQILNAYAGFYPKDLTPKQLEAIQDAAEEYYNLMYKV